MHIEEAIAKWDQKSASAIEAIYAHYCDDDNFIETIIKAIDNDTLQKGATWLLKRHLELKNALHATQSSMTLRKLNHLTDWESKLHLLQSLPYLTIDSANQKNVALFLRSHLNHQNKFVRAWTYNGFSVLAKQYPEYRDETKTLFEMAMRDEAASVKARIRNITKNSFK